MHKIIKLIKTETEKFTKNLKNLTMIKELKFYEIIHEMLLKNVRKTKREIFYSSPNVFKKEVVNRIINKFLKIHKIRLIDINVSASLKGIFYGELTFIEKSKIYTLKKI